MKPQTEDPYALPLPKKNGNPIFVGVDHGGLYVIALDPPLTGSQLGGGPLRPKHEQDQDAGSGAGKTSERSKPRPELRPVPGNGAVVDPL